ncbi:MAG: hypothetical protein AAF656_06405 [Planctomycetota bacterium]
MLRTSCRTAVTPALRKYAQPWWHLAKHVIEVMRVLGCGGERLGIVRIDSDGQ